MKKTDYRVPNVTVTLLEPSMLLSSSPLSVGYSDETTTGDANARGYGFDDYDEEEDYDPWARSRNSDYDW